MQMRQGIGRGIFVGLCMAMVCAIGVGQSRVSANAILQLDQGWQFRQILKAGETGQGSWMPAKVPGDVHLDLLANKKIEDPFYRDNESKLQWIEKASWEYSLSFDVTPELLARGNVDLVFDGLDAASQVFLNDVDVLEANNMFRIWRVPAKAHLKAGRNQLRVVFPSPDKIASEVAALDPWRARTKTMEKTYIRKAAYEYGWDWGPTFVTSGIWRPVRLEAWDAVRISDFAVRQRDVSKEVAHLNAEVEVESAHDGSTDVTLQYSDNGKSVRLSRTVHLRAGRNVVELPAEIEHPKLWYPAGYGEQSMYEFTVHVGAVDQQAEERTAKVGLRTVVLHRELDKWGRSFEFVVNGIPIFAKGADVIPFDSFPNRVTTADYRRILESARDANMNMLRHWGGGYYETEEFYSICDELGLMIWQDFQFGNEWQPGTYAFKQSIEVEAEDQVRRLRNHPSIVLWSGNNETEIAMNWDKNSVRAPEVKMQMMKDYLTEFSGILPRVVARLDSETPYWPSSPSADYEEITDHFHSGDTHDWTVWHGLVPFSDYEKRHWRFVSEYGFQSFPEWRTVESFTLPEDRTSIFTPVMLAHQKNDAGNSIIHDYTFKDYSEPKDFPSFLYVSQVLQAEGIKIGAEHFRRSMPETMGSIFWQLNDCWPVASWSSIDYYGRWKALQYYARRFYAPVLVSPHAEEGGVRVYVVSDKTTEMPANLRVRAMDFMGKVLLEETLPVKVSALTSKVYLQWTHDRLTAAGVTDLSHVFIVAELSAADKLVSRNLIYLVPVKTVQLAPAKLKYELVGTSGSYTLRVSSPVLARSVYAYFGDVDVQIADNYFDLLPGEVVELNVKSTASLDLLKGKLQVISLTDAFKATTTEASGSATK